MRSLVRQPGMVLVIVLTLALGIGASTALFAYLHTILRPTLDAPEPERVVWLYAGTREVPQNVASYPEYLDLRGRQTAIRDLAAVSPFGASVVHGSSASFAWGQYVSGNYFSFFGARPAAGRLLQAADDQPGVEPVVVVSHSFWKGALGGDAAAINKPLRINGKTYTLVGVAPEGFQGQGHMTPLYMPISSADRVSGIPRLEKRDNRWISLFGRLAPGISTQQAREALALTAQALDRAAPLEDGARLYTIQPSTVYDSSGETDTYLSAARVLMAAALLFLLLACANVANLLLARATQRQRDWGIRASLGASRRRLLGGVLGESLVLCGAGGLLGLALSAGMVRRIEAYVLTVPGGLGSWADDNQLIRLSPTVFLFGLLVSLLCALLCGLAPALRVLRGDLLAAVKSDLAGAPGPASSLAPRKLLVVVQVGLSVVLLLGGALLARTLRNAERVETGFNRDRLLFVSMYVPRSTGATDEGAAPIFRRVREEAASLSGVGSATLSYIVPLGGATRVTQVNPSGQPDRKVRTEYNLVSTGYFETLGIPILQGRALDPRDRRDAPPSVVISRSLAVKLWGDVNPVGRLLAAPEPPPRPGEPEGEVFQVVGVAGDVRSASVLEPPGPVLYFPVEQRAHSRLTLILRTAASPATMIPVLRQAVRTIHPDLAIVDVVTGDEQLLRGLAQQRMHAEIAGLFGLLGLGVSVVGLFALLSYSVSLRVREIGIRMAIGARPSSVARLVLRQGMTLVTIGLLLGLAGALGLTRLLKSLLYGVSTTDPLTFVGVAALLLAVAFAACFLPARRAGKLDPLTALRDG